MAALGAVAVHARRRLATDGDSLKAFVLEHRRDAGGRHVAEAARLLIWKAAWLASQSQPFARAASMAKLKAGDVAMSVTNDAIQILGGYGYIRDFPVEKWHRDAKIYQIWEGTAEIQRLVIARELTGRAL